MKKGIALLSALVLMFTLTGGAYAAVKITSVDEILALPPVGTVGPLSYNGNSSTVSTTATTKKTYYDLAITGTVYFKIGVEVLPRSPAVM